MKKYTFLHSLGGALLGVLLAAAAAQAQAPGSGGPPGPSTAVPLDGSASLLLASGVALGIKKLRARRAR